MSDRAKSAATAALSRWQQLHLRHLAHRRVVDRPPGERVLVLAPHPDDEVLGAGGTLVKLARSARVQLAYLTDGRIGAGDAAREEELARVRAEEARAVAAQLGVEEPALVGWNEHAFARPESEEALVDCAAELLEGADPDLVLVPFLWDAHGDHRYANHLLAKALAATGRRPLVCGYEVWSLAPPGYVVDVSEELEAKLALLACYPSQLALFDYVAMTRMRAALHAPLAPGAAACEVFWPVRGEAYVELVAGLDLASPASRETIVLMTPPETLP